MRRGKTTWLLALALLTIGGCGGGSTTQAPAETAEASQEPARAAGPVVVRGDDEVRARVGRAGGRLELANGSRLEIPEGALTEEVEVVFAAGSSARGAWDTETKRPLGPTLEVRPPVAASGGATFRISSPAIPIPDGFAPDDLALANEEETEGRQLSAVTATRWQMWPARVESGRFVAEMPVLGGHRVQFGVSR